ncbi:MAG: hypothetical protein HQL38_17860 [Alphaproteobacteria bacterium]|nr:hypothetical protein [Alphaproteobacteria bacterium]
MDAFVKKFKDVLLLAVFLMAGLLFAYWNIAVQGDEAAKTAASAVAEWLRKENVLLSEKLKDASDDKGEAGIRSVPDFLMRINEVARTNGILLRSLKPEEGGGGLAHRIKFIANYYGFLGFSAGLEFLDVVINSIEIRPYDINSQPPTHVISFVITPRNDAQNLQDERLSKLNAAVQAQNKRNPFQRFAFNKVSKSVTREIDVTWLYRLTGISKVNGDMMATVDSKDVVIGTILDGMTVTKIERDRVTLTKDESPNGLQIYVLKFRTKK